jgi:hypothetical protein
MKRQTALLTLLSQALKPGFCVAVVLLLYQLSASAVLLKGERPRNLTAPSGEFQKSGWQYQGYWGLFLGTPISPWHFITAKHVGGLIGDVFIYRGKSYETINVYKFPDCDLSIWTVATPFPEYAPLYTGREEIGKQIAIYGRGTSRGEPVTVGGRLRGWRWGSHDNLLSWGINNVAGIIPGGTTGDGQTGEKLFFDFSENGNDLEGTVSSGDSGGGVFLQEEGTWKLAGIVYGVSALYSLTGEHDDSFSGAIFDGRGLWQQVGAGFAYTGDVEFYPAATMSFAVRLSAYNDRIQKILNDPPQRQLFTRRRVTIAAGSLFLVSLLGFILRARRTLRRLTIRKRA